MQVRAIFEGKDIFLQLAAESKAEQGFLASLFPPDMNIQLHCSKTKAPHEDRAWDVDPKRLQMVEVSIKHFKPGPERGADGEVVDSYRMATP